MSIALRMGFVALAILLSGCAGGRSGGGSAQVSSDLKRCVDNRDQPDLVIGACTRAIHQGNLPDRGITLALSRRGLAYLDKGMIEPARRDFNSAVELSPRDVNGHLGRALINVRERKPEAALADYDRALEVRPNSAAVLVMRSEVHRQMGAIEKARTDVDSALLLEPRSAVALNARGNLRRVAGDLDGAFSDFDMAIASDAERRDAFENRGHIHFLRGDFIAAAGDYQRSLDPKSSSLDRALWLFIAEARVDDAAARDRLAKLRGTPTTRDMNALIVAMMLGRMSAEDVLEMVKDPDPRMEREKECAALFFAAEFNLWRGEKEKAEVLFRRAIATGATQTPTRAAAEAELARIDRIARPASPPLPKRGERAI